MNRPAALFGDLGILSVALIWGTANTIIRYALAGVSPLWFCALRFAIACASVWLVFGRRALRLPSRARASGALIGTLFVSAYILGAVALLHTTAGNESFIISMSVVFVPFAVGLLGRQFPERHITAAVALCVAGLAGLTLDESLSVNKGDLLCFGAMLCVTANIMLVQRFVRSVDPFGLACWQALGGMLLAFAAALVLEPIPGAISSETWFAIIYTATVGFALTLVLQNAAQRYTSATRAAILLSASGVFGAASGVIFLNEPMTARIFIAGALITAGVLLAETVPAVRSRARRARPEPIAPKT